MKKYYEFQMKCPSCGCGHWNVKRTYLQCEGDITACECSCGHKWEEIG